MKRINGKKFISNFAVRIAQSRAENDPEFLADIVKIFLNKYFFNSLTPNQLIVAFEEKEDLTSMINQNMHVLKKLSERVHLDSSKIKDLITRYLPEFEIDWIYQWWQTDQKKLYAALKNYHNRDNLEIYLVLEVKAVADKLVSSL